MIPPMRSLRRAMIHADEWRWHGRFVVCRRLGRAPIIGPTLTRVDNHLYLKHFSRDMQRLNDALAGTELADHYWVWAGALLGWAREGAPLAHDRDADFALLTQHRDLLERAIPVICRAGFTPYRRFRNNDGELTEVTFRRHRARFEFFLFTPVEGGLRYYLYRGTPHQPVEFEGRLPDQDLVEFEFLERRWLRHSNAEAELESLYGNWQVADPYWDYMRDNQSKVQERAWLGTDEPWSC
ncbi:MAG TPA: hypothetical protein VMV53_11520 [Acidimicrobiales bacterium]|nr:hypothetical protein [Acidimicrobiales bacterium]